MQLTNLHISPPHTERLLREALFYWGKRKPCGLWSARFDVRLPAAAATADPCLQELYIELAEDENSHAWLLRGILEAM